MAKCEVEGCGNETNYSLDGKPICSEHYEDAKWIPNRSWAYGMIEGLKEMLKPPMCPKCNKEMEYWEDDMYVGFWHCPQCRESKSFLSETVRNQSRIWG